MRIDRFRSVRSEEVDVIAGDQQTDQLEQLKDNAASGGVSENASSGLAEQPDLFELVFCG